jgi:2-haloacid dehalogenase
MSDRWATFDCYGTLIDWERGISDTMTGLWPDADPRALLARYHEIEPRTQAGTGVPYRDILALVLEGVAEAEGLDLPDHQRDALGRSLPEWPPFPEVAESLAELRARGWKIAILSNTDPGLLDASVRRIGVEVAVRITVSEAGSYKPAHGHWTRFFETTGVQRADHVHVAASLFHDIAPCAELGLTAVWINRNDETTDLAPAATLPDLRGLGDVLDGLMETGWSDATP